LAAVEGVRVAVIDSGIHPGHPHVLGVAGGVAIFRDGESDDYLDRLGHGTAVAAAIREKAPDAQLLAVKVFDRTLSSSVGALVRERVGSEWPSGRPDPSAAPILPGDLSLEERLRQRCRVLAKARDDSGRRRKRSRG
jgi:hypothetical protein